MRINGSFNWAFIHSLSITQCTVYSSFTDLRSYVLHEQRIFRPLNRYGTELSHIVLASYCKRKLHIRWSYWSFSINCRIWCYNQPQLFLEGLLKKCWYVAAHADGAPFSLKIKWTLSLVIRNWLSQWLWPKLRVYKQLRNSLNSIGYYPTVQPHYSPTSKSALGTFIDHAEPPLTHTDWCFASDNFRWAVQ